MKRAGRSPLVRVYFGGYRSLEGLTRFLSSVYTGLWLGIFRQRDLHGVSEVKYEQEGFYHTEEYNRRGLWDWERRSIERHFQGRKKLILLAAGGGREILALHELGFEVDGFESDEGLVRFANDLLEKEGLSSRVAVSAWDHCPPGDRRYDGGVVGWGAYMHIRGREKRVAFLRELRARLEPGSPVLLSFYTRMGKSKFFPIVARVGNVPARILGRDRVEVGDCLFPNFAHFFTRKEMEAELAEGGFEMLFFETAEYGHAVGQAV